MHRKKGGRPLGSPLFYYKDIIMIRYRLAQLAAAICIAIGLALAVPLTYFWVIDRQAVLNAPIVAAQPIIIKPSADTISGKPVRLQIPSLKFDLAVIDGTYDAKTGGWTLTLDKAQFAVPSMEPNNVGGDTLIYGHYRPEVFAYLHLIKSGATAKVITDNGYVFTYTYYKTQAFDPRDTSIFYYDGAPRLTLQTCSGTFFQNRQMYYFSYGGYSKV